MASVATLADRIHHPPKGAGCAPLFVWGTWGIAFLMALVYVGNYGHGLPLGDDYALVPHASGNVPMTALWLWEPWNGHRIPLPKLIMLGLLRLSGGDFRVGMYLNVLALGTLSFLLVWIARRLRGHTNYADAFSPLLLLHWGHSDIFLNCFQSQFVSSTILAGILLLVIIRNEALISPRTGFLVAICLILLTLCGIQGLLLVPPLALWLLYSEIRNWGSSGTGDKVWIMTAVGLTLGMLLAVPFFLLHNEHIGSSLIQPTFRGTVRTSLQFLSTGLGHKAKALWPMPAFGIAGLWLLSGILLVLVSWKRTTERCRSLGLFSFLLACALVALAVGWGRASWEYGTGFSIRYALLMALSLCCISWIWEFYSPRKVAPAVRLAFLIFAVFVFSINVLPGLRCGKYVDRIMVDFERDLRTHQPSFVLVGRHARFFLLADQATFADRLLQLRQAGIGPFRYMQDNPPFAEIPLAVKPTISSQGSEDGGAYFQFALPKPRNVAGIRISFANGSGTGVWSKLQAFWKGPDERDFPSFPEWPQATVWLPGTEQPDAATVWVGEIISGFRLRCDGEFGDSRIPRIVLLVPPPSDAGRAADSMRRSTESP